MNLFVLLPRYNSSKCIVVLTLLVFFPIKPSKAIIKFKNIKKREFVINSRFSSSLILNQKRSHNNKS